MSSRVSEKQHALAWIPSRVPLLPGFVVVCRGGVGSRRVRGVAAGLGPSVSSLSVAETSVGDAEARSSFFLLSVPKYFILVEYVRIYVSCGVLFLISTDFFFVYVCLSPVFETPHIPSHGAVSRTGNLCVIVCFFFFFLRTAPCVRMRIWFVFL